MSAPIMHPTSAELQMLADEMGALLPQNVDPWSYQLALESAFIPYGTSLAAAIVACCIFFCFFCAALGNYLYTKYPFYDVLCIATAFRTAAFGCRAAYIVRYRPALTGTFLAFNNAGFGANTATLCLVMGTWLNKVGHIYFRKGERYVYTAWTYILVVAIITFGPICGVIAAGLEYGAYTHYAASYGERIRTAASYGLIASVFGLLCLSLRICFSVFVTQHSKSGYVAETDTSPARQPRLVALFPLCLAFLCIRGATGVVAIYIPYETYWTEDRKFYPLDTLPEFLCLVVLCWPCLMARMAQSWPKGKLQDKKGKVHDSEQIQASHCDTQTAADVPNHGDKSAEKPAMSDPASGLNHGENHV